MKDYLISEYRALIREVKALDFKVTFIFLSVAIITFLSIVFASPNFYYEIVSRDKMYSRIYWFLADGMLMFAIPALIIKLIFKEKLSDYGFRLGDVKFGMITSISFFAVMLITVWIVSGSQKFAATYPQGGQKVSGSLIVFLLYELCVLVYMLGWEFFWRGYVLFGLKPKFGYYSIFIQMIPFFILHKGKPEIELFASIFAGLILGIQALRSNSFIYCWLLHWLVMLSIDGISVLRLRGDNYEIGIEGLLKLFF
ncbi:MAG: hypothetical protein HGGPFJEG_02194 [Ignavibacteria bacterium]|nr:hypothetical protein [Ignavibacteria bacterium]